MKQKTKKNLTQLKAFHKIKDRIVPRKEAIGRYTKALELMEKHNIISFLRIPASDCPGGRATEIVAGLIKRGKGGVPASTLEQGIADLYREGIKIRLEGIDEDLEGGLSNIQYKTLQNILNFAKETDIATSYTYEQLVSPVETQVLREVPRAIVPVNARKEELEGDSPDAAFVIITGGGSKVATEMLGRHVEYIRRVCAMLETGDLEAKREAFMGKVLEAISADAESSKNTAGKTWQIRYVSLALGKKEDAQKIFERALSEQAKRLEAIQTELDGMKRAEKRFADAHGEEGAWSNPGDAKRKQWAEELHSLNAQCKGNGKRAEELLAEVEGIAELLTVSRTVFGSRIPHGIPGMEKITATMGITARTIQNCESNRTHIMRSVSKQE